MFGIGKKREPSVGLRLIGSWRAESKRGEATSLIQAVYHDDGSFAVRTSFGGAQEMQPRTQVGRYRVESIDKQRFRLVTIDENGAPLGSSVRRFLDEDTMLNEMGETRFKRVRGDSTEV